MITDPLLQILLVVFQVDQTRVFPSTTLLLSSTGRCQVPKTAVAARGLLVRSPNDMLNKRWRRKTRTFPKSAERQTEEQTHKPTTRKHCATVATFQWPGAYVIAHGKFSSVLHLTCALTVATWSRVTQDGTTHATPSWPSWKV